MPKPIEGKVTYNEEYLYRIYASKIEPRLDDIKRMMYEGYTWSDMAKELDVSNSLLWSMRRNKKPQYSPLREALRFSECQIETVEHSLYRKATGFYYIEEQPMVVTKEYYNKKGKKCKDQRVEIVPIRKYVPADTNAIKFFLVNKHASVYSMEGKPTDQEHAMFIEGMRNVLVSVKKFADEQDDSDSRSEESSQ